MKTQYSKILTKSDRALEAEEAGLVTYSQAPAWLKRSIRAGKARPAQWHHTGAAANRTDYYEVNEDDRLTDAEEATYSASLKVEKTKASTTETIRVSGTYREMVGGYSRGARARWEETEFTGVLNPATGWIALDDGGKKRSDGTNITWNREEN